MLQTDDRQTTDGTAIAYSKREREFMFVKKWMQVATKFTHRPERHQAS